MAAFGIPFWTATSCTRRASLVGAKSTELFQRGSRHSRYAHEFAPRRCAGDECDVRAWYVQQGGQIFHQAGVCFAVCRWGCQLQLECITVAPDDCRSRRVWLHVQRENHIARGVGPQPGMCGRTHSGKKLHDACPQVGDQHQNDLQNQQQDERGEVHIGYRWNDALHGR